MIFNINDYVKVKLNETGLDILRQQHDELKTHIPDLEEFVPPKVDENGYSNFQLWILMETFGPYMTQSLYPPFETDIIIENQSLRND